MKIPIKHGGLTWGGLTSYIPGTQNKKKHDAQKKNTNSFQGQGSGWVHVVRKKNSTTCGAPPPPNPNSKKTNKK